MHISSLNVPRLFNMFFEDMINEIYNNRELVLASINEILKSQSYTVVDFGLSETTIELGDNEIITNSIDYINQLNAEEKIVFATIINNVNKNNGYIIFLDGLVGSGKNICV